MKENIAIIIDTLKTRKWENLSHLYNFIIIINLLLFWTTVDKNQKQIK